MFGKALGKGLVALAAALAVTAGSGQAIAEAPTSHDWPMWRYDAGRSGNTPHALNEELHLHWVLQLPRARRAWPEQIDDHGKLAFDTSYEPVAAAGKLFVPSMITDSVTAYDLDCGTEQWRYYTDGPVRLAPAFSEGRLYVASDDGHLHCLDASSGELLWRFRAAPSRRTVLGNERLISMWPARGAPVVHEGVVYFAAGVWPFEGVYLYALDAETAEVRWEHSGAGTYSSDAYSETARSFSTIAPQGYLAVAGDRLIVSGGRTTPGVFDRATGSLLEFDRVHGREGGYAVFAPPDYDGSSPRRFLLPVDRCVIQTGSQAHDSHSWSEKVDGPVWRLLAADRRMIAVTEEGGIHVFGPEQREPVVHRLEVESLPQREDEWTERVAQLLGDTGATSGYAVMFGIGSGRLLDELLAQSDLHVAAFDPDAEKVRRFRERYVGAGLYGERVAVQQGDALSTRLPPYIARLVVSEDPGAAGLDGGRSFAEALFHPLRPYGGVAYVPLPDASQAAFIAAAERAELPGAEVRRGPGCVMMGRPGALPGSDTWTHQYADAANTGYSADDRVKAPLGVSWFGGTTNEKTLPRHMFGPIPQVVEGRLIILGVNHISARCVYTGREIWSTELPLAGEFFTSLAHEERFQPGARVYFPSHHGANFVGSTYVSTPDSVYIVHDDRCLRVDLATGETLAAFELPDRDTLHARLADPSPSYAARATEEHDRRWGHISTWGEYLIVGAYPHIYQRRPDRPDLETPRGENHIVVEREVPWHWNATSSEYLLAMDRQTGEIQWVQQARHGFRHNAIATAAGRTFAIDHVSEEVWSWLGRRGVEPDVKPEVRAIDTETGKTLWTYDDHVFGTWLAYSEEHDVLIQSGRPGGRSTLPDEPREEILALRGSDGDELWRGRTRFGHGPLALHDAQRRILPVSLDLVTGERVGREHPMTGDDDTWRFAANKRCGTQNVSKHLLTFRSSMASYHDLVNESGTGNLSGVRAGCTNNMISADGVLNVPDYTRTCSCAYQLQTSFGLATMPDVEVWTLNTHADPEPGTIRRVGINFGAPGCRAADGLLWVNYPEHEHVSRPGVPVQVQAADGEAPQWFHRHSLRIAAGGAGPRWVAASGAEGVRRVRLEGLYGHGGNPASGARYTVRLHFAEPEPLEPGQRVFDVRVQGQTVAEQLDVVEAAGGPNDAYVAEFSGVRLDEENSLTIEFAPRDGSIRPPLICGLEVRLEE